MINEFEDKKISKDKKPASEDGASRRESAESRASHIQYGALPYRITKNGSLEYLLVTTRQTKRWIIPKGWPIKGLKPAQSAAREAYEEAGIRGAMSGKPIGAFSYEKRLNDEYGSTIPCEVRVFALRVERRFETWPEAHERESRWFEPLHALSALKDEGLRNLVASFAKKTTGARPN